MNDRVSALLLGQPYPAPAGWTTGVMTNARGQALRFGTLKQSANPQAHIACLPGKGQVIEEHHELAEDFHAEGCAFHVLERHGSGLSGRYLKDIFKLHSAGTEADMADVVQYAVHHIPDDGAPVILLGHSAGAMLAFRLANAYPKIFHAPSVTAPPLALLHYILRDREHTFVKLGKNLKPSWSERYIPGGKGWAPRANPSRYSSHAERSMQHDFIMAANPDMRVGDPTIGWVHNLCTDIVMIRESGWLDSLAQPAVIAIAGQDFYANVPRVREFLKPFQKRFRILDFEDGKHDLLTEDDCIRGPIIQATLDLIPLAKARMSARTP